MGWPISHRGRQEAQWDYEQSMKPASEGCVLTAVCMLEEDEGWDGVRLQQARGSGWQSQSPLLEEAAVDSGEFLPVPG